jgi:N utilization substance protein A
LAQRLVEQGYLSYDDLSVIEPEYLMEMGGISAEEVDLIVAQADERVEEAERLAEQQKVQKKQREQAEQQLGGSKAGSGAASSGASAAIAPAKPEVETETSVSPEDSTGASEETMDQSDVPDRK